MILIDNIEMPKCCYDCRFLDDYGDYPTCLVTGSSRGYTFRTREKIMPNCPLYEITKCENCIFCVSYTYNNEIYYECHNEEGLFSNVNEDSFCSRGIHR